MKTRLKLEIIGVVYYNQLVVPLNTVVLFEVWCQWRAEGDADGATAPGVHSRGHPILDFLV